MKSDDLNRRMEKILEFDSLDEQIQFEAEMIHLDIVNEIQLLMEKRGINKSELASDLGVTKGYITQLFTGDKLLNLKTLAKLQRVFNVRFSCDFTMPEIETEHMDIYENKEYKTGHQESADANIEFAIRPEYSEEDEMLLAG